MSFLYDAVLPGSAALLVERGSGEREGKNGHKAKASGSRASLLGSLLQWTKDPIATLGGTISTASLPQDVTTGPEEGRRQVLYLRMREAETYEEYKAAATALDILEGNNAWKADEASDEYNAVLVAARLKQLDEARISCDVKKMMFLLRTSLTRNLGGMGHLRLYKHSHIGTKSLIERYIDSAQKTLTALMDVSAKQGSDCPIEPRVLVEELVLARQSFGRSALLLSGGGTFGMNHIGVLKCLWEQRLLPRIISGSSAGSIVCAVLCTKTDAEIPQVLQEFCHGDLAVFEREGAEEGAMKKIARFFKYGSLFDISLLMGVMRKLLGDMTFQESYNRTRRILNITVSSASHYELPRLLNYITAPNVMIWSAVCASCSVPLVFSPASLLAKDPRTGKEVPWNQIPNVNWVDGSVDNDLPMTRLAEMFNVNHFIVSQVNPHVVPFLTKEEDITGEEPDPSWIQNVTDLAKGEALHRLHVLSELGIFPNYATKARSVLSQRYAGDITIFPAISYSQFPGILKNPTPEFMERCLLVGERATWPKLSRIQNHLAIELALDDTIRQMRARVVFSPDSIDLRLNNIGRAQDVTPGLAQPPKRGTLRRMATHSHLPAAGSMPVSPEQPKRSIVRLAIPRATSPAPAQSLQNKPEEDVPDEGVSSSSEPDDWVSDDEMDDVDSFTLVPPFIPTSTLWKTQQQPLTSAPQLLTPSYHTTPYLSHRNNSLLNLGMMMHHSQQHHPSNNAQETPKHNQLFHPAPLPGTVSDKTAANPDVSRGVRRTVQPLEAHSPAAFLHTETVPEKQAVASVASLEAHSCSDQDLATPEGSGALISGSAERLANTKAGRIGEEERETRRV